MALLNPEDLVDLLQPYTFRAEVTVDGDEVTVVVQPLGVLGFGESLDEALHDAVTEVALRTETFFADPAFYRKSERGRELPWLLRFALTPAEQRVQLLAERPWKPETDAEGEASVPGRGERRQVVTTR